MKLTLLTRDEFRDSVFRRDGHRCVFCDKNAVDAHHILDRKLWSDGGYYLDNGASVCEEHHLACETTEISVESVRAACGITNIVLPDQLSSDEKYDKWGNVVLPNGKRTKGALFYEEGTQKMLRASGAVDDFTRYVKYPRTFHLPWSEGLTSDDKMLASLDQFVGKQVMVTVKMDGENASLYCDHYHARSLDSKHHPSRDWIKQFWNSIKHEIPEGWRICGENMYAKHSIHYSDLSSYFLGFSIWDEYNICLNSVETLEWFNLLGITPVETIYTGIWDEAAIRALWTSPLKDNHEGYVVRLVEAIRYSEFSSKVGKFVRAKHVQTDTHWMHGQVEKNLLA